MTTTDRIQNDFTLTWTLDAAPAEVFRAWTDPEHLGWYYNDAQPIPSEPLELDLSVGGAWRQYMVIDEDTAYYTGGVYLEIVPDEKLVFAWGATDGWPKLDPDNLGHSPTVTVALERLGDRTQLTVHVELPDGMPDDGLRQWWSMIRDGWRDTVDRLAARLAQAA